MPSFLSLVVPWARLTLLSSLVTPFGFSAAPTTAPAAADLWSADNLVAWCIVPFDAKKRDPEQRAEMLQRLGFKHHAYDWRAEHLPTFEAEIQAMQRRGIEITAWWFPRTLDADAKRILEVIERTKIHPQLWVTGGGAPTKSVAEQQQRIEQELQRLRPIVQAAARIGCVVGLYNHEQWFGDPDNEIILLQRLRAEQLENVRLIYNFHHGHDHIADFAARWVRMAPFVDVVSINGMVASASKPEQKIRYVGEGEHEFVMMKIIQQSGWRGKIAILNHRTDVDAEEGLRKNLAGLEVFRRQLESGRR